MKNLNEKARAYALKNAIAHDGKAQAGNVISALFNEGLKKDDVKKYIKQVSEIVNEINKFSIEEQKDQFESLKKEVHKRKSREGLQNLPKTKKGVVMRFAPSASGPLHIGHIMTSCISYLYVKKYGGKFYFRIEDTNPENIYKPAYKMLEDEAKWLFHNKAKIIIQSDRLPLYYKYAENLIKKGAAYVCTCSADDFKELVDNKKDCPCRNAKISDNILRWKNMLAKNGYIPGEAVLRFKSSMQHKNPAMRDFPLARVNTFPHPRAGKKHRVWPLMNLAVAVDDIEHKMTHIIRAKDHRDNAERQKMIYEALGLKKKLPWTGFLGRIHFKDLHLSTTEFRHEILAGVYSGWDDPKLPTLASLKKQSYKPEAFYKFAERVGLSENDKVMDRKEFFTLLDGFNR